MSAEVETRERRPPLVPVVETKFRPPRLREGMIERSDLFARLREGRERTLTLVCAPAGYGKTTLLAQWEVADRGRTPFVWIGLDERDSDPVRLWSHVVAGLRGLHESVGETSLDAIAAGPRAISEHVVPRLVTELSECPPSVLILDDWQVVRNPTCDKTVAEFVERVPDAVQVVVSSRSDPGLRVARLRAHGDLSELRAADLRLAPREVATLFGHSGIRLRSRDAERLAARTEGWLAGLCLAVLVVKGQESPRSFVAAFSGDTRHVLDYLASDVLDSLSDEQREFLLRTSVLERLSAPLCDAVLERSDSAKMLADAERANLFLVSLDENGTEYRYHQLFAAMLLRELEATQPALVPQLRARAARWLEEHGEVERAIDHAIAGRDLAKASTLVMRIAVPFLSIGRMVTVNRWFEGLSWPEAQADRQLAAMRGLAARLSGQGRDEVERWLSVAETGPDFGPLSNGISSIRSAIAMVSSTYLSRGIGDAVAAATLVLESEPAGSEWRYAGLVPLGQALYLAGRGEEARGPLEEARRLPGARQRLTTALALAYLSLIELDQGRLADAERLGRESLACAEELGHRASPGAANSHLALGCALAHGADLHDAIAHLVHAVHLTAVADAEYWHAHALLRLAAARNRIGERHGAQDALALAKTNLDELPDTGILTTLYEQAASAVASRPRREGYVGDDLSLAELRVLRRLAEGGSVAQVARELWLSSNTVKTHRRSIYRKLGASTREEMLVSAEERGILDPERGDDP